MTGRPLVIMLRNDRVHSDRTLPNHREWRAQKPCFSASFKHNTVSRKRWTGNLRRRQVEAPSQTCGPSCKLDALEESAERFLKKKMVGTRRLELLTSTVSR
jgi:hypothetical protein